MAAMPERAPGVHGCDGCCHPEGQDAFWEKVVLAGFPDTPNANDIDTMEASGARALPEPSQEYGGWPVPEMLRKISVNGCARCGDDHRLPFYELERAMRTGRLVWTHWTLCPSTGEPIMMRFVEESRNG
jgi:hypothetical protein